MITKNEVTSRDAVGNITQKQINTGAVSYGYDAKYRLTNYTNTNAEPSSQVFAYDYRGNRKTMVSVPGGTTNYWIGPNNTNTMVSPYDDRMYDDRGNMGRKFITLYNWDYKNRLINVHQPIEYFTDVNYTYNNADRMLSRTIDGKTRMYFYNGNQLLCEKDENGRLAKIYVNDNEGLLGFTRLNYVGAGLDLSNYEPLYYLFNEQGSVTAITNEVGKPIKQYLYDPYGNLTNTTTDPINNFTFIGRYGGFRDWSTGMTQFQHRWYESKTGRWVSRDPIGIQGGMNIYEYTGDNVVNYSDENGLIDSNASKKCLDTFNRCIDDMKRDTFLSGLGKHFFNELKYDIPCHIICLPTLAGEMVCFMACAGTSSLINGIDVRQYEKENTEINNFINERIETCNCNYDTCLHKAGGK
jgi:RHS repeat-associated protein